ncbi:MAG: Rid family detoxifying hydrolase [Clostridiaceae bacterium]
MKKEAIIAKNAPAAIGPYSHCNKAGNLIFVSGQLPLKDGELMTDIKEATRACLDNLKAILEEAGSSMDNVVKTLVFLTDMANFADMNGVYAEYFKENCPARSAIAVAGLPKGAILEIEAVAVVD